MSDAHVSFVPETSQITEPSNSHLANIGAELLKPPADFTNSPPVGAKSLPEVDVILISPVFPFLQENTKGKGESSLYSFKIVGEVQTFFGG